MSVLRTVRRWVGSVIHPKVVVGKVNHACPTVRLGSDYGGWTVNPSLLSPSSVVYSFGIGEDISFDLALIQRIGCTVHAFDPTPRSIEWVRRQNLPDKFILHEYGLAAHDGTVTFYAPRNPSHISHTIIEGAQGDDHITVPVKRLSTIMAELGHSHVDLLKMDIEGAEYDVVEDVVRSRAKITQLLIEYHHRFAQVGPSKTQASLDLLDRAEFKLFCISDSTEEYSFINDRPAAGVGPL
jgi:FkbM family methyltransferase